MINYQESASDDYFYYPLLAQSSFFSFALPELERTWGELGLGVTATFGKYGELYANVKYQRNIGDEYRQSFAGQAAYRYSW